MSVPVERFRHSEAHQFRCAYFDPVNQGCNVHLQSSWEKPLALPNTATVWGVERGRCLQVTSTFLLRDLCASSLDACVVPTRLSHCMIITQHGNGVGCGARTLLAGYILTLRASVQRATNTYSRPVPVLRYLPRRSPRLRCR